jgi:capsule polysaccharide export protein KpsE/RkpR
LLASKTRISTEKSGFLLVSVTDKDKNRAAEIANTYTEELRVLTKTLAVTEASQRRIYYEEQLKHANEDLIAAELSFQQFQQKKGLVELDTQAKALITSLTGLRAQIAVKQVEVQALRSYSTEHNPEVQLAENQLSSLQGEAARLEQHSHSSGPSDLGLQDVAGEGIEYLHAEHELQYRQIIFDLLLKQYDVARLDEAKDATIVQVVEPAIPPDNKSSPHRAQILLLFTLLGFIGVCLYLNVRNIAQRNPEISRSVADFRLALIGR